MVSRISSATSPMVMASSSSAADTEFPPCATFTIFTAYSCFVRRCMAFFTTANPPVPRTSVNAKSYSIGVVMPPVAPSRLGTPAVKVSLGRPRASRTDPLAASRRSSTSTPVMVAYMLLNSLNDSVPSALASCSRMARPTSALKSRSDSPGRFRPKSVSTRVSSSTSMRPSPSSSCWSKKDRAVEAIAACVPGARAKLGRT